jgi:hypothetical protein
MQTKGKISWSEDSFMPGIAMAQPDKLLYQFIRECEVKLILILAIQKQTKALVAREEADAQNGGEEEDENHQEGNEDEDEEDDNPQPIKHACSDRPFMDIEESAYAE